MLAMDEKRQYEDSKSPFDRPRSSLDDPEQPLPAWHPSSLQCRDRTLRRLFITICILLATWTFSCSLVRSSSAPSSRSIDEQRKVLSDGLPQIIDSGNKTRNVSLEAHVMSKCPDAKACLRGLVVPAMEKISDKVDFELSFIGR